MSSYPPGAALNPFAPYNQKDPPCIICGSTDYGGQLCLFRNGRDDCIDAASTRLLMELEQELRARADLLQEIINKRPDKEGL